MRRPYFFARLSISSDLTGAEAESQCLVLASCGSIVLRSHKQFTLVLLIIDHTEDVPRNGTKGETVGDPQQRRWIWRPQAATE
jgi:hypothetical protein